MLMLEIVGLFEKDVINRLFLTYAQVCTFERLLLIYHVLGTRKECKPTFVVGVPVILLGVFLPYSVWINQLNIRRFIFPTPTKKQINKYLCMHL